MSDREIRTISINDPLYPQLLREIKDPPKLLYYIGSFPPPNLFPLAVVGSRDCDNYGKQALLKILDEEILNNTTIISGLARGIDADAHKIAKYTIAVLGSGLDKESFYPKENINLRQEILDKGGLIISEYSPGTRANARHFPERNRIVAGLCQAALIIQARKRSGALITARLALENGRDVLAVPGSILSELSHGCHYLISQGAAPITNNDDLKQCLTHNPQIVHYL